MPIYEYVCSKCGEKFEKLTALADAHKTQECPKCGKMAGERILSAASLGSSNVRGAGGGGCSPTGFG